MGFLKTLRISNTHVTFQYADQAARTILLNHSLWLEHHVFKLIHQLEATGKLQIDDLRAGVVFQWNSGESTQIPVTNEIDIMVTRASKLFYISCKAGAKIKNVAKVLNEIELYSRKLGDIYYHPALVLTSPPDSNMKRRAALTRVRLFVANDHLQDELAAWLNQ